MPHSIGRLSMSASSHHSLSLAAFITNIAESDFRYTQATIVVAKWENALDENRLKQVLNREIDPAGLPGAVPL
jgi:hypothetical protein